MIGSLKACKVTTATVLCYPIIFYCTTFLFAVGC